ncbi:uncharacterized protein LOC134241038 [Saccostrea cucullata]|uniref:uncharacterized protein LOC134241038 n=1 Tax=Saccostrea cuccullata TaxID=36930 RepID=UPI002ED50716
MSKRSHVEVSVEELLMIFRSYLIHKCNWPLILADIRSNINFLPENARTLYMEGAFEKLKRRMSDQVRRYMKDDSVKIENPELLSIVTTLRASDKRYSEKLTPSDRYQKSVTFGRCTDVPSAVEDSGDSEPSCSKPDKTSTPVKDTAVPAKNTASTSYQPDRKRAIPVSEADDTDSEIEQQQPLKRKKSTSELARMCYENYLERLPQNAELEKKMYLCMDKFLNM